MIGFELECDPSGGVEPGYMRLAAAMLAHAIRDYFQSKDLETMLSCLYFLISEDARLYMDTLEIDQHPLQPICDGMAVFKQRRISNRLNRVS